MKINEDEDQINQTKLLLREYKIIKTNTKNTGNVDKVHDIKELQNLSATSVFKIPNV